MINYLFARQQFIRRSAFFIVGFAVFYYLLDVGEKTRNGKTSQFSYGELTNNSNFRKFWNKLYLSITTTTTIGNGSIKPVHPLSQLAVGLQSLTVFVLITELVR